MAFIAVFIGTTLCTSFINSHQFNTTAQPLRWLRHLKVFERLLQLAVTMNFNCKGTAILIQFKAANTFVRS
jgi:hypothetical protein